MDTITIAQFVIGGLLLLIGFIWFAPKGPDKNSGRFTPHSSDTQRWTERK